MPKLKRKLRKFLPAAFSLFLFLFTLHVTPFSQTIFHAVVHEQGIHHSHEGAPADHTQQDHNLDDFQDPMLSCVSLTAGGLARYAAQALGSILPVSWAAYEFLPELEPPPLGNFKEASFSPPKSTVSRLLNSPLRAPPSA